MPQIVRQTQARQDKVGNVTFRRVRVTTVVMEIQQCISFIFLTYVVRCLSCNKYVQVLLLDRTNPLSVLSCCICRSQQCRTHLGLHVKFPIFLLHDFKHMWIFSIDFRENIHFIKFHEYPSCSSCADPCGRRDKQDMAKLMGDFSHCGKVPDKNEFSG